MMGIAEELRSTLDHEKEELRVILDHLDAERPRRLALARAGRGSPEAVEKRKAARALNSVLGIPGISLLIAAKFDGRLERRRQRLLQELKDGKFRRTGRLLKPLDVLTHVQELLELGEPLSSLQKQAKKPRPLRVPEETVAKIVERLHRAYSFLPETYAFVGIRRHILVSAGIVKE